MKEVVLLQRWYDRQLDKWTDWEEIPKRKLLEKYGSTIEEWKNSCENWIEIGGTYEYRIIERVSTDIWSTSFEK